MSTTLEMKQSAIREHHGIDSVRERILAYEHQMKQYLDHLDAKVEYYRFSVEKHGEGIGIEVSVKATIAPKPKELTVNS